MDSIVEELGIPKKYLKSTSINDRFVACVHKSWLKSLVKHSKLIEFIEKCNKQDIWSANEDCNIFWEHILVRVFKKWDVKVLPLPRIRKVDIPNTPLFLIQLLQYISQTNYRNLSKSAKKKLLSDDKISKEKQITLVQYNDALKNIICRVYGCPILNICDTNLNIETSEEFEVHLNVLPAVCCIETLNSIFLIHIPYIEHTMNDCINFSPAILEKCFTKPLFVIYQLLQVLKGLHDRSLTVGNISLSDIYLTEDLWIYIMPDLTSNLHVHNADVDLLKEDTQYDCLKNGHLFNYQLKCEYCGICTFDRVQITDENLEKLCELWLNGDISNFTYITALNNLSGRRLGDPNCHHVFPWVTDFASRCGKNWRDLKKSKYRLNKGDQQLDLTFEGSQTQVSHHVSDVLSEITYYVYMARRTPKSVLCKNVRTIWVPAEYPSSIQRMQKWTPDECIPEFFTDPSIFRSIHDDLDDLEVPAWCTGPEDFIQKHREALESQHVSERLHHWIDLTFGFKLSGNAAVKAKNVCLHLADEHTNLTKSGIVQLFNYPHPPRYSISQALTVFPSRPSIQKIPRQRNRDRSHSSVGAETTTKVVEDEEHTEDSVTAVTPRSSLSFTRYLSQSRTSLNEEIDHKSSKSPSRSSSVGPKTSTFTSHVKSRAQSNVVKTDTILLPKDFKPELALDLLEKRHIFFSRTFHPECSETIIPPKESEENHSLLTTNDSTVQNSFTNFIFSEPFQMSSKGSSSRINMYPKERSNLYPSVSKHKLVSKKNENAIFCNYVEVISKCRVKELQVFGCLIVEIFLPKRMQALSMNKQKLTFNDRLRACVAVLRSCEAEVPLCVKYIANLLLQPQTEDFRDFSYPVITDFGLPSPSAHLLLEPLLNFNIPFSKHFPMLYKLLSILKNLDNISNEMNVLYHFDCDGTMCPNYENLERTKILFIQNIAECKVKTCAKLINIIFDELNTTTDVEVINILIPYVKQLIEDPPTSVLAAWYLFDPMARVMGPQKTASNLLESVLKLYENEPSETTVPYHGRIAKLYHHSFLLRLMVRLGLKCFLENFAAPIIEAVGGYKDYEKVDFVLHSHHEKILKKTSHLKNMDTEVCESSPSDDSSFSSTSKLNISSEQIKVPQEPEIFDFEEEKPSEKQLKSLIEHLELNVSSDLPFNHSAAEEALDAALSENIEHLRSLEELNINITKDYDEKLFMSPTIPIPTLKHPEFNNISCEIGSKKSENELYDKKLIDTGTTSDNLESPDVKQRCSTSGLSKNNKRETKISDMSSDSLLWLSHRLGPVLTARYLSRNLLKMLTLCYVGRENLYPSSDYNSQNDIISVTDSYVIGDQNAVKVLDCLGNIAGLYGEQFILFQYIPHMSELIALCKKKITPNLEGGLISCLALLKHVIPYISDSTLMDQLQDNILKNVIHPTVRLLGSTKYVFPSGHVARTVLAKKYLDAMYVLSIRIGAEMTRTHLAVPALQRFFMIFDKVHANENYNNFEEQKANSTFQEQDSIIEISTDGSCREWNLSTIRPIRITQVHAIDTQSIDSMSPPTNPDANKGDNPTDAAFEELQLVFTPELAHIAYIPFLKHLGLSSIEISLKNHDTIKYLCKEHTNEAEGTLPKEIPNARTSDNNKTTCSAHSGSIGSNVAVIGNRIEVQCESEETSNTDLLNLVSNKIENNNRHLRGNWLAYWGHEIGRSEKDVMFSFKQIKLQTFNGHTHSVKCLFPLDNENSFMSGSRDKTVKLWSLRSQGDGSSVSNCQWTYTAHKKSVLAITFIESMRLVASCDSVIHIWDPFMGVNVALLESPKYAPVNTLKSMPAPSCLVYAATTDGTLKVIDTRLCSYIYELKVSLNPPGLIRCLAVSPSGLWVAAGQSSGNIAVLDTRTGLIISSWRAHEGEVLQLVTVDNNTLISSSLDQNISVWNVPDGKFKFHMRGSTEPVHCLNVYNTELISGSTANRIGVHTSIDVDASFSSTKLRSDAFKGLLTSMVLLPLNRLLLLGADTGNINLLC